MDIELGIQNVARTVTFTTDATAQEVSATIERALSNNEQLDLMDNKGRHIIVPAGCLGYAIVGAEARHAVGFNNL